ncbi:MAG: 2-oxoglutarate dehydrogenase, component, dihydrolipoamide succinyltransferase [Acidobacteria bacterium]|nr:2-oxoglutarate dehydrogenase, component, dihydrolipoamide succinyltransferase [Acidobacteriota bacterium]
MATEVVMPQMGESIAEGTITKWLKNVGDRVERDEPLFEISTDKVDAEIPSPAAGILTEIKFKEGDTVEVNKVIAILDGDGAGASAAATTEAPAAPAPTEARVEALAAAEPNAPVEDAAPVQAAAKAQEAETPAPRSITDQALEAKEAAASKVAAPQAPESPAPEAPKPASAPAQSSAPSAPSAPPAPRSGDGVTVEDLRRTKSSPLVRKIASEHGIDIARLEGTGMSGRVTKNDILSFIESGPSAIKTPPSPAAAPAQPQAKAVQPQRAAAAAEPAALPPPRPMEGDRVEQMSVMRKKIAEHMVLSRRTSAHVTTVYEIDVTKIARLRDQHKAAFLERTGTKLTFMPFIFQALTKAIRKFPIFNAQLAGDQIIYKRDINLGMAVALDWGLIVPVIKRADDLSISGLARAANDLADRARTKQLKPDEVAGGTFTVTNPGVFGGLFGTPIINQPQVAILGVGKIEKRPRVLTSNDDEDYLAIRWMVYFALSFDHRIIDGADAERFLAYVKELLEEGEFSL